MLSPIYGDFHGLPPTILTSGTRDLLLSNTVRTERTTRPMPRLDRSASIASSSAVERASRSGLVTARASPSRMKARHSATLSRCATLETCSQNRRSQPAAFKSMGGERLDTRNPTSKLMLTILAGVATWERECWSASVKALLRPKERANTKGARRLGPPG